MNAIAEAAILSRKAVIDVPPVTLNWIGPQIAKSRYCTVHEFGPDRIVKLYNREIGRSAVTTHWQRSVIVGGTGLAVPAVHGGVVRDRASSRLGIVYDRAHGFSLKQFMLGSAQRQKVQLLRMLVEEHRLIHSIGAQPGLPTQRLILAQAIDSIPSLTPDQRVGALSLLNSLPDGEVLCHGDFGAQNVMFDGERATVVDWSDACNGHVLGDLTRAWAQMRFPRDGSFKTRLRRRYAAWYYLQRYLKHYAFDLRELRQWMFLNALIRLKDFREPAEQVAIRAFLRQRSPLWK